MAVPIGAIISAVGGIVGGLNKASGKGKFGKNIGAPSMVDPRQAAMINLMQAERRAAKTGTSSYSQRMGARKDIERILRRKALLGDSTLGDVSAYRTGIEQVITKGVAEERMGMLSPLVEQTENTAKRILDLESLNQERGLLKQEAGMQNLKKNATALLGQQLFTGKGGETTDNNKNIGNAITGLLSQIGNNNSGGGGGNNSGGGGGFDWGGLLNTAGKLFSSMGNGGGTN